MEHTSNGHLWTETIYDLPTHNEFVNGFIYTQPPNVIARLFNLIATTYLVFLIRDRLTALLFIAVAGVFLFQTFSRKLRQKKGDKQYHEILQFHQGREPHHIITFRDTDIQCRNPATGNGDNYSYDQIKSIIETEHLFLLTTRQQLTLIASKLWVKNGSKEDLAALLLNRCKGVKRFRRETLGRWIERSLWLVLAVGFILTLKQFTSSPMSLDTGSTIFNDRPAAEILAQLEPAGITCDDSAILEEMDRLDYGADYSKALDLLCRLGYGEYDYETWEWAPSNSGVYWFDAECINVDSIYTDFLRGVSGMNPETLNFTNIQEDYSQVDWENGTGPVTVSFDWNDSHYTLDAQLRYDWFDEDVLFELMDIIAAECPGRYLHYTFDGGQGYLVFFGSDADADTLSHVAGVTFYRSTPLFH